MNNNVNPKELVNSIIQKCWDDNEFKTDFIANPKATIAEFVDPSSILPPQAGLAVVDQTDPEVFYINIPPKEWAGLMDLSTEDMELSDEQLEAVAGGDIFCGILLGVLAGAAAYGLGYAAGL